ncbi:MAG: radical SAM protein [Paludibacteraceae bacterium]|nr:radical SAM protein [Paludibacteraceae bacterium]
MKIRIVTLGCKLNFAESSALMNTLVSKGHQRAKQGEQADVVIVNTCTVTDTADHKDRQAIHRLKRENPNAKIIVTGCYAHLKPQEIAAMVEVDHVLPKRDDIFQPAYSRDDRTRCFLKVQDGCNYFCTYCTIPFARGRSRNPYIKDIVAQAQQALADGAKEIILTGVNIGDFGRSTGESFIDLLRALDNLQPTAYYLLPTYRIRISSCEPNLLTDEIIDFVAHSKHFAPHFHIPLQSGNNEVLKIMHRHYTRELFQERIEHIKAVMPHAFIGVDCMVGVRGETQERFEDYVQFISALPVSQLHVFTYSERANTRMLEMDLYVVPQRERERRSKVLHTISEQKLADFYAQHKGKKVTVLWESKKDGNKMYGFSENYIKVAGPYDKSKINTFEQIVLS